ncbi:TRAP transporter small permease [Chloroflexota bacterium]
MVQKLLAELELGVAKAYRMLGRISAASSLIAGLLLFVLMTAGVIDVVSVQSFSTPIYIAYEFVITFLVLVVWLSLAHVEHKHEQITATFFYDRFPSRVRDSIDVFSSLAAMVISAILSYLATIRLLRAFEIGELIPMGQYMPLTPIRLVFAIGIYLFTAVCLIKFVYTLIRVLRPHQSLLDSVKGVN